MSAKMNRAAMWIVAAGLVAVASPIVAASDAASAKAFVEKLYSHYPLNPNGKGFNPTGKNAGNVFDPGLVAAFREDSRLANGEVGFVDSDPLCQCQDDSGLKSKVVSVALTAPNAADAVVNLQYADKTQTTLTLHLVPVNGAWRIYDLSAGDVKSYRTDLLKANEEAAAQHH
jgi:hypothetical protein